MTKENQNRQRVLFERVAAFFLLSQNELSRRYSDYSVAQFTALLGQTPETVIGQTTRGQLAPIHHDGRWLVLASSVQQLERSDVPVLRRSNRLGLGRPVRAEKNLMGKGSGDGWYVPASSIRLWLDRQLFQISGKVGAFAADFAARLHCLAAGWLGIVGGMGFLAEKVIPIRDADRVEAAAVQRPLAGARTHPVEIVKLPVGGLEPTIKPSFPLETEGSCASDTALTQTTAQSENATEQDHHPGLDMATRQAVGRCGEGGGGGVCRVVGVEKSDGSD